MHNHLVILTSVLHYNILIHQSWLLMQTGTREVSGKGLFGVPFLFVLKFMGKLLLLFIVSAIISKLLKLDSVYKNLNHHEDT